jgi:putative addiction module killer protein
MDHIEIQLYALPSGKEPFIEWERDLNRDVEAIVTSRLARLRTGNFGDSKTVGDGVYELRIHYGPGYRIYYGKKGKTIVILLCRGDKSTQKKDIKKAKIFWADCLQDQQRTRRKK